MRSNLLVGISSAVAAVAVAGSASAGIVWSGVQSATGLDSLVITNDGSFLTVETTDDNGDMTAPTVAVGTFGIGTRSSAAAAFLLGSTYTGNFQFYGTISSSGSSTLRNVKNNASGASIQSLTGTLAATSSTAGSGWSLFGTSGSTNAFFALNTASTSGAAQGEFRGTTGYIAFRFSDDGSSWKYGWAKYTGGTTGSVGTISEWAYNDTVGGSITAGQVPAPGAIALLGIAGLAGRRRKA